MKHSWELAEKEIVHLIEVDDVQRNKYLYKFVKIICNNGTNQVFSLDGAWGSGKTTFIKKLELLINYYSFYENGEKIENNNYINNDLELSSENITILERVSKTGNYSKIKEMVRKNNLNAIYFNAWEHDDEENPIISIIFEIVNRFDLLDSTKSIGGGDFASNLKSLISLISMGKINIGDLINDFDLATSVRLKNKIKIALAETLNDIITENCNKLVVFIDELDRCRPDYAIDLLEKLKHYIDDERVVFVLSTNMHELIHTIGTKYGNEFSSEKYLDKFIDERLFLPEIPLNYYLSTFDSNIQVGNSHWISIVVTHFIKHYKLEMREINRYMGCIRHFEKYINESDPFDSHMKIINFIFIPYAVGLNVNSPINFLLFKNGNGYDQFQEFIKKNKSLIRLCKMSFYTASTDIEDVRLFVDLKKYYDLIFVEKDNSAYIKIDNYNVYKSSFDTFESKLSLLGDIAEFQEPVDEIEN